MSRGTIAVVTACRDGGETLPDAVGSALLQTRAAAEIVVVDDGSTDPRTVALLDHWMREPPSPAVRIVRRAAEGLAAARNAGVQATRADYLVPLDADDLLEPRYLELAAAALDADARLSFVSSALRAFGSASYEWTPPEPTLFNGLARGVVHQSTVHRRTVWEAVGGYDPAAGVCVDMDYWLAAAALGHRGSVLPEALLRYRVRPGSMYHGALARNDYQDGLEHVLRKRRVEIERLGPPLLLAKEAFVQELRIHQRALEARRAALPGEIRSLASRTVPPPGAVDLGSLRRTSPLSRAWGLDRGGALDRYYIEAFLERHRGDVRGHVLEVKDPHYTERFGGPAVTQVDVLDVDAANPRATIVADLTRAEGLPSDTFDCFILTQTLHIVFDVQAALEHAARILRPGGVLLATLPAVSRVNDEDGGLESGDYWRFTAAAVRRLFTRAFGAGAFEVTTSGNVLACTAFLYGLAPGELERGELDHVDPWFPLVHCVRAVKRP